MPEQRRVPVGPVRKQALRPQFAGRPPGPAGAATEAEEPVTPTDDIDCDCPRLDRPDWHEAESDWSDITFLRSAVGAAMGVPVGYGAAVAELRAKAANLGATLPDDAMVLLGDGALRRPLWLEVEGVPAKHAHRPGGIAYTHLVPAPMGHMKSAVKATVEAAMRRYGRKPDETMVWYLTCRDCSGVRDFETLIVAHYRKKP
jgi:hypothetical protein